MDSLLEKASSSLRSLLANLSWWYRSLLGAFATEKRIGKAGDCQAATDETDHTPEWYRSDRPVGLIYRNVKNPERRLRQPGATPGFNESIPGVAFKDNSAARNSCGPIRYS